MLENHVETTTPNAEVRGTARSGTPLWTEEQTALLHSLYAADELTFSEMARKLNEETGAEFTRNAVIGRAHRLGLKRGPRGPRAPRSPRLRVIRPTAPPDGPPPAFLGISFFDLEPQHCRFPYGEPMLFCGNPVIEGASYCARCYAVCHEQGPRSPRVFWPFRRAA